MTTKRSPSEPGFRDSPVTVFDGGDVGPPGLEDGLPQSLVVGPVWMLP